ncbi:unnamed protein product, partial [Sphacelaria rigidula]
LACAIYAVEVTRVKMRHHVGGHMLQREELQKMNVCRFCARSGQCRSSTKVPTKRNQVGTVLSDCRYAPRADMRGEEVHLCLSSAKVASRSTPCTNLPILCNFCVQPQYIWKYGMDDHVAVEHADKCALLQSDDEAKAFVNEYTVSGAEKQLVLAAF